MRVSKLTFIVMFACSVAIPAVAQDSTSDAPAARTPTAAELGAAMKMMNKKTYMEQMGKVFEQIDANHDGNIDQKELMSSNKPRPGQAGWVEDKKISSATPVVSVTPVTPATPVTPIKKAEPYKASDDTSVGVPPINADQIQK